MRNANIKISIVIPLYNEEAGIKACLDSIKNQTMAPYEVILVDNNCTDDTLAIARTYDFCRILQEPKQGIIFARDKGFNNVTGDIVARVDGDSILCHDWVEQVTSFFADSNNAAYCGCTGGLYFSDSKLGWLSTVMHALSYFGIARLIYRRQVFYGSNMAFRASYIPSIEKYSTYDTQQIHEDVDLTFVLSRYGKVKKLPNLIVGVSFQKAIANPEKMLRYVVYLVSWWRYKPFNRA